MKSIRKMLAASAAAMFSLFTMAQGQQVFIYSPDQNGGLHIARQDSTGWHDLGRLCSSDYGTWGAEKRMFHPSVTRAKDGTWRLVFQVNDRSPVFAASYSRDLVNWRPQDYPRQSTRQCLEPIVFENEDGTFDIYYKSDKGKRFVSATPNFRDFAPDESSQIDDLAWTRDTATIGGRLMEGYQFELNADEMDIIERHFRDSERAWQLSNERMHDDASRLAHLTAPMKGTLRVDLSQQKPISDKLIGIFFEDISYAADGGLYAELVQNRDFEYTPRDHGGWSATTAWHSNAPIRIDDKQPLSANNPHYAVVSEDSLLNEGWDGIAVEMGKKYDFSMFVRGKKNFIVALLAPDGTVIAKTKLKVKGQTSGWERCSAVLTARKTETKARLLVLPQGRDEACVDMVSLFPQDTFRGRKNGLRKDLAQVIADLHPKFVRFPGGCMSHGQGLDNIYHWHHTVGPLQDRKPDFNIWHYHQTRGLGFYEYFQFCEDIGAEPLPVLAAGVPCQNSANNADGMGGQQGGIPMDQMPAYIQEILDLIEWANGDPATSKWAKMRADAGHPAPFHLKYIGLGNEDIISTVFEERFTMIARAVRAKYPDIKICGTVGPFHAPSADYLEGWEFTKAHPDLQYMVDEHYYESTGWFMHNRHYYDSYDRNSAKVYLGEWAASTKTKRPNVETALAEALYLTDIERNGDVVEMTSYAPMLCKDGHSNWNPDMIYFSNNDVRTTPAYDVQRLFSVYGGDTYIHSELSLKDSTLGYRVGASVVKDSKTGKTYLKLVNALPVELQLQTDGIAISATSRTESFEGKPEQQKLELKQGVAGNNLHLPPYSMRVIEL